MLEKSHNASQKSSVFSSLKEACYYHSLYGGKIYTISKCQLEFVEVDEDSSQLEESPVGETYYVLNVADKKVLTNGFLPIKELLLQYHNFKMYEAYKTMTGNNVKVYSVKTDAFTIHEDDLDKVFRFQLFGRSNGLLKCGNEIGDWRIEGKTHIQLPTNSYTYKYNEVPEIPKIKNFNIDVQMNGIQKKYVRRLLNKIRRLLKVQCREQVRVI